MAADPIASEGLRGSRSFAGDKAGRRVLISNECWDSADILWGNRAVSVPRAWRCRSAANGRGRRALFFLLEKTKGAPIPSKNTVMVELSHCWWTGRRANYFDEKKDWVARVLDTRKNVSDKLWLSHQVVDTDNSQGCSYILSILTDTSSLLNLIHKYFISSSDVFKHTYQMKLGLLFSPWSLPRCTAYPTRKY